MTDEIARSPEPAAPESAAPEAAPQVTEPTTTAPTEAPAATEPQVESAASPPDPHKDRHRPSHERKRDAKQAALELAKGLAAKKEPAPVEASEPGETTDTDTRARDPETGRFLPTAPATEGTQTAAPVAEGFVRIDLEEGHPLREQGRTYLDVPAGIERDIRTLANSPVRRKELERAEHQRARLEAENAQLRERLAEAAARSEVGDPLSDPKSKRLYDDIKAKYGEDKAEEYRAGLQARTEQQVGERRRELIRSQEMYAAGEAFRAELIQRAPQEFHLWGDQIRDRLAPHLEAYAEAVDSGKITSPSVDDFFVRVRAAYLADPTVSAAVREWRQRRDQQLREEAAAEARKQVEREAKEREQQRLVGRLPRVETGVPATAGETGQPPANETPGQRKKRLRNEAIAAAAQLTR
jgi:hypothetical protein